MARKLRLQYAGAFYHVINRGNYRADVFASDGAKDAFLECLGEACEKTGWKVHGYVVMRNHYHLALETPEPNLVEGMQWLQSTYANRFNRFRGERGHVFQGRYQAIVVEDGAHLGAVAHYIHLNPVRAKIVPLVRLADYPSSSLALFGSRQRPAVLVADTVLGESGGLPDTPAGWRRYADYLRMTAEEDTKLREERFGRLSRGWAIGSAEFKADLRKEFAARAVGSGGLELRGADGEAHREMRALLWEDRLGQLAKRLKVALDRLPARKSAEPKVRLAAAMKAVSSVSNVWLAERLRMGRPASVSQYVRRFRLRGGANAASFKAALAQVSR